MASEVLLDTEVQVSWLSVAKFCNAVIIARMMSEQISPISIAEVPR